MIAGCRSPDGHGRCRNEGEPQRRLNRSICERESGPRSASTAAKRSPTRRRKSKRAARAAGRCRRAAPAAAAGSWSTAKPRVLVDFATAGSGRGPPVRPARTAARFASIRPSAPAAAGRSACPSIPFLTDQSSAAPASTRARVGDGERAPPCHTASIVGDPARATGRSNAMPHCRNRAASGCLGLSGARLAARCEGRSP
jgi:hypothetical protein